jgi:hypothetical protein
MNLEGQDSGLTVMQLERGWAGVPVVKLLPSVEDQAIPARQLQRRGEVIFPVLVGRDADASKTAFLRDGLPQAGKFFARHRVNYTLAVPPAPGASRPQRPETPVPLPVWKLDAATADFLPNFTKKLSCNLFVWRDPSGGRQALPSGSGPKGARRSGFQRGGSRRLRPQRSVGKDWPDCFFPLPTSTCRGGSPALTCAMRGVSLPLSFARSGDVVDADGWGRFVVIVHVWQD